MRMTPIFESCKSCFVKPCCTKLCDNFLNEREMYFTELTHYLDTYTYNSNSHRKIPSSIHLKIKLLSDKLAYSNEKLNKEICGINLLL